MRQRPRGWQRQVSSVFPAPFRPEAPVRLVVSGQGCKRHRDGGATRRRSALDTTPPTVTTMVNRNRAGTQTPGPANHGQAQAKPGTSQRSRPQNPTPGPTQNPTPGPANTADQDPTQDKPTRRGTDNGPAQPPKDRRGNGEGSRGIRSSVNRRYCRRRCHHSAARFPAECRSETARHESY